MSVKKQWTVEQAEHVLGQIADSIEAASPGEIEEDVLSSGEDAEALAAQTKAALLAGVKEFQQKKLHHGATDALRTIWPYPRLSLWHMPSMMEPRPRIWRKDFYPRRICFRIYSDIYLILERD